MQRQLKSHEKLVQLRDSMKHQTFERPPSCREKQDDHTRVLIRSGVVIFLGSIMGNLH